MVMIDPKKFGAGLKKIRVNKRFSLRQVSTQSKTDKLPPISPSYWSLVERGERNIPKIETLKRMAKGLRVSSAVILQLAGLRENKPQKTPKNAIPFDIENAVPIPVVGTIKCGPNGIAMSDYDGFEFASKSDVSDGESYFWLRTSGDSMTGDFIRDGDYALIEKTQSFDNGDICAVIVDGEEGTLKHVTRENNVITLSASNPVYPPRVFVNEAMDNVYIAGKLIEIKHKF